MQTNQSLTFNDLPEVISRLVDKVESLETALLRHMSSADKVPAADKHQPLTVREACDFLRMPVATFYYKVERGEIPAVKQGKRYYIYRDELEHWLECGRKNAPALTAEQMNADILASHRRKPNRKDW